MSERPDNSEAIHLRRARFADIPLLEYWDGLPHIVEATGCDEGEPGAWDWKNEIAAEPPWRELLVAELRGNAIGFVQIIDPYLEETHYWGDCEQNLRAIDIWIGEAENLGRGYGSRIMSQALERCFAATRVSAVLIDPLIANTRAIAFYRKMGFQPVEERVFGEDECLVMRLERDIFEKH